MGEFVIFAINNEKVINNDLQIMRPRDLVRRDNSVFIVATRGKPLSGALCKEQRLSMNDHEARSPRA